MDNITMKSTFASTSQSAALLEEIQRYVIVEPFPFVIDLARSYGMYLTTVDGDEIFDWAGYFGSKLLGHNHPGLYEEEYLRKLTVAANNKVANPDFLTPECLEYYRLLYALAPQCMANEKLEVYAINSGAEAMENLLKYLLIKHREKLSARGESAKTQRFIYFDRAFHGRTVYALNVTQALHDPDVTQEFERFSFGNIKIPFPSVHTECTEAWNHERTQKSLQMVELTLQQYCNEIAGIVVEPVQGAGGHRIAQREFFCELSRLAHQYDTYLAFDEIQTAGGQTGSIFACDQFDLPYPPQAVAVAKKFANGAVYMYESMENRGVLDSTWGGSLADMVRFCQEWKIVQREKLIEQVPQKAARLVNGLEQLAKQYSPLIFNVRGMGLYQGFTLRSETLKSQLQKVALEEEKLLLLGGGMQTIRLRSALDVTGEEIDLFLAKLERSLMRVKVLL